VPFAAPNGVERRMPMSDSNPRQDVKPKVPPDGEDEDSSFEQVAGGLNPCPEPPSPLKLASLLTRILARINPVNR
jgi:hypothetical protein